MLITKNETIKSLNNKIEAAGSSIKLIFKIKVVKNFLKI